VLEIIASSILISLCSVVVLGYLGRIWIENRLKSAIEHEYSVKLEKFKSEQLRKEKAAVVAEFLAEWTHLENGNTKRLNQLLWELSLYLPSNLVSDIKSMVTSRDGKTAPEILVKIRNHLLNDTDPIQISDITHFKHPNNNSMVSNLTNHLSGTPNGAP